MASTQPENTFHPVETTHSTEDVTHPTRHAHQQQIPSEQPLPPSYEQAKTAPKSHDYQNAGPATVIPLNQLADKPQWIDCPFCRQRTTVIIEREGTSMQIVVGAVLCLICVCLTCLPCLAGWFEDTKYRCSSCNNMVAVRRHDGPLEIFGPQVPVVSQYNGSQAPMDYNLQQQQCVPKDGQNSQHDQQQQFRSQQQQQHRPRDPQQLHELHELHEIQPQQPSPAAQPPVKN